MIERRDRRSGARRLVQRASQRGSSIPASPGTPRPRRSPFPARPTPGSRRCGSGAALRTLWRRRRSGRTRSAAARPEAMPIVDEVRPDEVPVGQARGWASRGERGRRAQRRGRRGRRVPMRAARRRPAPARPEPRARRTAARESRRARQAPTTSVVQCMLAERPWIHDASSRHALSPLG